MPSLQERAEAIAAQYEDQTTGRPTVLSDDIRVQKLLHALRAGNYREIACKVSGISRGAFYEWLKRDAVFLEAVEKAEADAECDLIEATTKAGRQPQFWAANMTLLERKHPDRWGRRQEDSSAPKVVVQIGVQSGDVSVSLSPVPRKELAAESTG